MGLLILPIVLFLIVAIVIVVKGIEAGKLERQRKQALMGWAARKGYDWYERSMLHEEYGEIDLFNVGNNRYLYNTMIGELDGMQLVISDYHYETVNKDAEGKEKISHHHCTVFVLDLPFRFPTEVRIRPETWLDKISGALGFSDIDFESGEFSRKFHVISRDRKLAYDIVHPQMMEFLIKFRGLNPSVELDQHALCVAHHGHVAWSQFENWLMFVEGFVRHFPDYLKQDLASRQ